MRAAGTHLVEPVPALHRGAATPTHHRKPASTKLPSGSSRSESSVERHETKTGEGSGPTREELYRHSLRRCRHGPASPLACPVMMLASADEQHDQERRCAYSTLFYSW